MSSLDLRLTTHCIVIMVAVDESNYPNKVSEWVPNTEKEKELHASTIKLMDVRENIGKEMEACINRQN